MMRNIPTITRNLLIINVLVRFLSSRGRTAAMAATAGSTHLGLHFFMAPDFRLYQLFTYMFMHGGWDHLFFNMFALWMFGCVVERVWGPKKFLFYYISCGVGAGLFQELAQFGQFYLMARGFGFVVYGVGHGHRVNWNPGPRWVPLVPSMPFCWLSA